MAINSNICSHFFHFALMTTEAFSRKVGTLFSELKLVTDNLSLYSRIFMCILLYIYLYTVDSDYLRVRPGFCHFVCLPATLR